MAELNEDVVDNDVDQGAGDAGEQGGSGQEDPIKNLKSEFSRKLENLNSQITNQNSQIEQMLQTLQQRMSDGASSGDAASEAGIPDDIAYDSEKLADYINKSATKIASQQIQDSMRQTQERAQVVQNIAAKYPEFQSESSEEYKKALEVHSRLPKNLQGTAQGAKLAMLEVVQEFGLVPKDKRSDNSAADDFSVSGGGSSKGRRASNKGDSGDGEIDPKTVAFAKLINPGRSEKDVVKGLKEVAKRDKWKKYQSIEGKGN